MRVKKGALYCAEHLTQGPDVEGTEDKRVPCPLDPAHTVYESRLKAHLKKCNASVSEIIPSYFSKDMNVLVHDEEAGSVGSKPKVSDLVERIIEASKGLSSTVVTERFRIDRDSLNNEVISESEKHRIQQKALMDLILERVKNEGEKYEKVVIVEFGAGKGGLSNYLWENYFIQNLKTIESEFILIDRSNFRLKKDAKMKHSGADLKRIFIDIKDLNLSQLFSQYNREKTYFLWVSKHLCGTATCLTINSLTNLEYKLKGTFCVALCCHQCCSCKTYPNMKYLRELGVLREGEDEGKVFKMLCSITSWTVCGFRESAESDGDESDCDEIVKRTKLDSVIEDVLSDSEVSDEEIYSTEKKESVGRMMKRIFDFGRQIKLNASLFSDVNGCELKHYIEEEVTLENAVLVGHTTNI